MLLCCFWSAIFPFTDFNLKEFQAYGNNNICLTMDAVLDLAQATWKRTTILIERKRLKDSVNSAKTEICFEAKKYTLNGNNHTSVYCIVAVWGVQFELLTHLGHWGRALPRPPAERACALCLMKQDSLIWPHQSLPDSHTESYSDSPEPFWEHLHVCMCFCTQKGVSVEIVTGLCERGSHHQS